MKEFRKREIAFNFVQLEHNSTKMVKAMKRYNKEVTVIEMMGEEKSKARHEVDAIFVEKTAMAMKSTHIGMMAKKSMKSKGIDFSSMIKSRKADALSAPAKV